MYKDKKVLGLIPARGGSKGLPKKNLRDLCGKPMIAWSIERALKSDFLDRVIVSTDDVAIAGVAKTYGSEVPFMRPEGLATDTASSADVVIHALDFVEGQGEKYDYIALIEPTSPLRKKADIDRGIQDIISDEAADTLVSVGEVHMEHPMIIKRVTDGKVEPYADFPSIHQRQQADSAYFPYGVLYISKVEEYKKSKTFYGDKTIPLFIERWQNYEVDDIIDFITIERIMKEYSFEFRLEDNNG